MKTGRKNAFRRQGKQPISKQPAAFDPSSVDLLFQRATAHHQAGQLPQAEALCRQILKHSPLHPGALHLLGGIALQAEHYAKALRLFDRAIQVNPDDAGAFFNRGNALYVLQQYQAAVESYDKAILLKPDFAEAHHNRGSALSAMQQFQAAIESYDKAILLKPDYAEACTNWANTHQALMQYQATLQNYEKAILLHPEYESCKNTGVFDSVENQVAQIAKIKDKSMMKAALDALPLDLHSHPAVCSLRNANFVKTKSSGKDLVFYCLATSEIWNPRTASAKGIGGSEEAVIWLSRLLRQRGWNVTVYAYCGAREEDFDGVSWKPYWMWNHRDKQDVTVLWRYPQIATYPINSDKVIVDLHDTVAMEELTPERLQRIHRIFVKSSFHRSLFPNVPDEKFVIIPNGIDAKLFEGVADRDPLLLINTSSADRSIEAFLDCFEQIKKQVPDVKAQWAYGWGVWDSFYSSDAEKLQWKTRMQERMKELGVEERGRISHGEIAQLYHKANIFSYPSEFTEIDCISLSKAMAAGAIPVTTDFAAMGEKSQHGGVFIHSNKLNAYWAQSGQFHFEITDPEQKAEFVRETVKLLLNPPSELERGPMREWARSTFDWNKIADSWNEVLAGRVAQGAAALERIDTAVRKNSEEAALAFDRGNKLYLAQRYQAAIESYDKAILLNPDFAEAHHNRGSALNALKQYQAAIESYDKAILLKPDYAEACCNRGNTLSFLHQYHAALESYDRAILLNPKFTDAHFNRGNTLLTLQQYQPALESYDKVILLNPDYADAYNNRGSVLLALRQHEAGLECFDKTILLKPNSVDAHSNRGNTLMALKQYRAAMESFDKALLLKPDHEYLRGMWLYMKRLLCDWQGIESESRKLEALIDRGMKATPPFTILAISSSPEVQKQAAEIHVRDKVPERSTAESIPRRPRRDKIRIGYFSADYYNHATTYLMAELFERHDRGRFEILGFSFGPRRTDQMSQRTSSAMDQFFDLRSLTDREAAELSRKLEVDIAVDLKGFTEDNRAGIFAERAAPIQVSYIGYPGTMSASYMDYLIADHTLISEADRRYYSEKIIYLPDSYQVNDSLRAISPKSYARAGEGLPESAFVFCCFNQTYKISPSVFDSWMRILGRVEGSVLWLIDHNPWAVENLRAEAARHGIAPERLVFAKNLLVDEHLARQRLADLFLDTLPYNAHTTASDALWAGVPVLTRIGETFAGRVAASLLRAVGLPELITTTESEYEELAVALAHAPQRLQALRQRLQQNHLTAPLFDCKTYTRYLESAYTAIYERYLAGLPPDHIVIPRLPSKQPAISGPPSVDLLFQRATTHQKAGQMPQAEALYQQILQLSPGHAGAWHMLGVIASQVGQGAPALELIDKAIQVNPEYAEDGCSRGNEPNLAQQYQETVESCDKAIQLKPDSAETYCNRGIAQYALQQYQASLESCGKAIFLKPGFAKAYFNRGNALHALEQYQAALESYDKAILLKPDYTEAYYNRGNALHSLERYQEAIESYDKAILLKPDFAEAYHNRGSELHDLKQYQAALESFDKAILLKPDYAKAHNNRGNALHSLERCHEALDSYDKAILFNPKFTDAHFNRGNTLLTLQQYQAALESYDKAILYSPGYQYVLGIRLYMKRFLCNWEGIESECRNLEAAVERGERVVMPFQMLAIGTSPAIQRKAAEIYVRDKAPERVNAADIPRRPRPDRIRIGYFSADYYKHATSYLIAELFERHDRSKFEIIGFSFGPNTMDEMTRRISTAMDRFLDVRSMLDLEVAELSRKLEVDIAVDLNGFTANSRPGIFAQRAAPIQINYLAYPGTMGADYMDYLIADHTLIPEADRRYYSEKIIYLPDSYQVNDSLRAISPMPCARIEEGLPETAFVFCCFNNIYKISPSVFDIWMRVLSRVEGSVLWLLEDNPWAVENLRKEALRRGIEPQRLIFARRVPADQHLARQRFADLFLDTLPYNAHTTASDALWAGLPVLTRIGETFAGRVAASLLRAVGLPELITTTESEYEELAVALAHDPQRLLALRQRLQQNHLTAPLFDCKTYTRHLESAYTAIYERYLAGLPPDHIVIPRLPS